MTISNSMSYQEIQDELKRAKERRETWRDCLLDLSPAELKKFIWDMHRAETDENPRIFIKGIRACLYSLGYPDSWVNGEFYDMILEEFDTDKFNREFFGKNEPK